MVGLPAGFSKGGPSNHGEAAALLLRVDGSSTGGSTRRNGFYAAAAMGVMLVMAFVSGGTWNASLGDGVVMVEEGASQQQQRQRWTGDSSSSEDISAREQPRASRASSRHPSLGGVLLGELGSKFEEAAEPGPFVAMEGMFEYEKWDKLRFEELVGGGSLHQMLENYGASVPWNTIRSAIDTGLGAKGRRKLFFLVRHAQAMHNEWGLKQKHVREPENIPCNYKEPGDLVDPELTEKGRLDVRTYVHDVFESGLAEKIGNKVRAFSSPLSRCLRTSLIGFRNTSGLEIADGRVTASELLRERMDPRVPFETRRPVNLTPGSVPAADKVVASGMDTGVDAADSNGNDADRVVGDGENQDEMALHNTSDGSCFVPSRGLEGHSGDCCLRLGLTQKFGDFFDINVSLGNGGGGSGGGTDTGGAGGGGGGVDGGCKLSEVAEVGWDHCKGREMLAMLAEDDLGLEPSEEESEWSVVQRLRTWFAAVFDEVDEDVVVAVTHSDWISHAMTDLGIRKPWFVPRNNEILPVIVEDTRPSSEEKVTDSNKK